MKWLNFVNCAATNLISLEENTTAGLNKFYRIVLHTTFNVEPNSQKSDDV